MSLLASKVIGRIRAACIRLALVKIIGGGRGEDLGLIQLLDKTHGQGSPTEFLVTVRWWKKEDGGGHNPLAVMHESLEGGAIGLGLWSRSQQESGLGLDFLSELEAPTVADGVDKKTVT